MHLWTEPGRGHRLVRTAEVRALGLPGQRRPFTGSAARLTCDCCWCLQKGLFPSPKMTGTVLNARREKVTIFAVLALD